MCFSAAASFTASALLITTGLYSVKIAWGKETSWLPLAVVPVGFGIQQGLEGLVWLGLHSAQATLTHTGSVGYLFFSHGFWPFWIPLAAFFLAQNPKTKQILGGVMAVGLLFALFLYVPMVIAPNGFNAIINHGSIDYQTHLIYDALWPRGGSRLIYLTIAALPMWLINRWHSRLFAGLSALSLVATYGAFNYAFVSVWCFFAAILSFYIVYLIQSNPLSEAASSSS
ncbi:MAG: DUF6629 family protein [Phormidesmis sp.]